MRARGHRNDRLSAGIFDTETRKDKEEGDYDEIIQQTRYDTEQKTKNIYLDRTAGECYLSNRCFTVVLPQKNS